MEKNRKITDFWTKNWEIFGNYERAIIDRFGTENWEIRGKKIRFGGGGREMSFSSGKIDFLIDLETILL